MDVGANIGLFSLFINSLQKDVKIYAFEPIKPIFEVLQANISLHSLDNIRLFNYGLSSENNSEQLFTFYPNMAGNSTTKPQEKLAQREAMNDVLSPEQVQYFFQSDQVQGELKTLSSVIDELDLKSIDLLKIDVEGEEYEVLKGTSEKDWSKIKQIFAEVHDQDGRSDKIQMLLESHGFTVKVEKNNLLPGTFDNLNLYAVRN